jgi:Flp pilus assembly protein CpaB
MIVKLLYGHEKERSVFRIKKHIHMAVALLISCLAGFLIWYYLNLNIPSVPVLIISEKVSIGEEINSKSVQIKTYPKSAVPRGALSSLSQIAGKTVVSGTLFPGDIIRDIHLAFDNKSLRSILNQLAPGKEAIDLPAGTASGFSGISEGDHVKVFTEVVYGQDMVRVEPVVEDSIVLKTPQKEKKDINSMETYVIAVTPEESIKIAEGIVTGKKFSCSLLPGGESK